MDALELQAALVKLDPATTVTPITSNVKLMSNHRITFVVDVDGDDLTLRRNTLEIDEKQLNVGSSGGGNCSSSIEHQQSSSTITTNTNTISTNGTRKLQNANCGGASLLTATTTTTTTTTTHQNHQTSQQQMGVSKCNLVEVR
ncbi:PREDICTED: uncharacterized protein LOC107071817 [Polistes dominula]|uniref:Uncharacterized protein LOC107071817 n=1 Tax=Polistes dominula TaxID=743375 RepID=A0ABM1J2D8_POLDO|nr:PREDICTED: uncharacterized protein LOC107071817 [Polistes dominula]